jgi:predicted amidohydrolase
MPATIIASVAQCGTVHNDTPATLRKMRSIAGDAKKSDNSQLIVFPEAFIGGEVAFL